MMTVTITPLHLEGKGYLNGEISVCWKLREQRGHEYTLRRKIFEDGRQETYRQIEEILSLYAPTILSILKDHLHVTMSEKHCCF